MIAALLKRLYWRWMLDHARRFRASLETTIANERIRAQRAVEQAEVELRRAEMAVVAARADTRLASRKA